MRKSIGANGGSVLKYIIINTLLENNIESRGAISDLSRSIAISDVIYTEGMKIHGCIGCNGCWMKTPGVCRIKDDYEQILIKILQSDRIIFITEAKFGFVSWKMKNLIDRLLPIGVIYSEFKNGRTRHCARYKKCADMGLLFTGDGDAVYLSAWMKQISLNLCAKSFGVFEISDGKELCDAFSHD
jgi:multimeric flavodoxin WrbA